MSLSRERKPPHFAYDWATTRVYNLDTLWWGVAIGGRHYTGHVSWHPPGSCTYPRHEIERSLSLREAKDLYRDRDGGEGSGERYWKLGVARKTNRFDTREQLERAAAKWVEQHAAGVPNWVLLDGDAMNPSRPVAAAGWFKDRVLQMTALAEAWSKVPNGVRLSTLPACRKVWNVTYGVWYDLLTPPDAPAATKRKPRRKATS